MEMKYVVPDMAQSFGTLEFAGESEPVFAVLIGSGRMYLDDTLCDKYRLPVVLNVFVFCNFYGFV